MRVNLTEGQREKRGVGGVVGDLGGHGDWRMRVGWGYGCGCLCERDMHWY